MIRVGQKLHDERVRKGLTLEDVAKGTKIRTSFLLAIEKGEYGKLPSSAYALGFVKNYSLFLGLPTREMLALFRREFDEEKAFSVLPKGLTATEDFSLRRFKLEQAILVGIFIFLALLGYILFQYRYAFINPPLEISAPKEGASVSSQAVISGTTDSNATVYVNNLPVTVDESGHFDKTIDLFPGKTVIFIKAINRFGRETKVQRHVEVK